MTVIRQQDLIDSIADSLQFISYYHPKDYIQALGKAYEQEESPAAKDAIAQILTNSRMCAEGHRPICQDTGIVTCFVRVGMNVRWDDASMSVTDMINEGVRRAYNHPDNKLRASILLDPAGARKNTRDNTPAVIHYEIVPGDTIDVDIAAKGGGSENKTKFVMLNPSDSIVDWVIKTVPQMGAGWCPPGMLGIGIGGTAEKAMVLAKEALMEEIDIHDLIARGPSNRAVSFNEDTSKTFALTDFGFSDIDAGNSLQSVTVTTLEALGALKLNGVDVTLNQVISAADITAGKLSYTPVANGNGATYASFGFKVSDGLLSSASAYTMALNVAAVNDALTGSVTLSGTAKQGQILTASNTLADVDGLGTIAYQWLADGVAIAGATAKTLALGQAQVGKAISVKAGYTDLQGTAESKTSSVTAVVANVNDAPTASN